ncbi:hypothetical protein TL16_g07849 [Triparma laevis f. inornata]|uniref:Uncharacterized protein n=1 Tax=Triparma laevis f. inornata TaxID=1714386 RepID=A0A9W7AVA6_9STRA|nr:hypothetical protein TL16_g07849 [Triparma laevis f. inornata]
MIKFSASNTKRKSGLQALTFKETMNKSVPDLVPDFNSVKTKQEGTCLNGLNPKLTNHIDMKYLTMDPNSNAVLKARGGDDTVSSYKVGNSVAFLWVKPSVNIKGVDIIPVTVDSCKFYEIDTDYYIQVQIYPVVVHF